MQRDNCLSIIAVAIAIAAEYYRTVVKFLRVKALLRLCCPLHTSHFILDAKLSVVCLLQVFCKEGKYSITLAFPSVPVVISFPVASFSTC